MEQEKRTEAGQRQNRGRLTGCSKALYRPVHMSVTVRSTYLWLVLMLPGIGKKIKKDPTRILNVKLLLQWPRVNEKLTPSPLPYLSSRKRKKRTKGRLKSTCLIIHIFARIKPRTTNKKKKKRWKNEAAWEQNKHSFPGKNNGAKQAQLQQALDWTHQPAPQSWTFLSFLFLSYGHCPLKGVVACSVFPGLAVLFFSHQRTKGE